MSFLIVLAFLGAFAFIVSFAIRSTRAQQERREQALRDLGFHPVTLPNQELQERLDHAYRWRKTPVRIQRAYSRHGFTSRLYLVDLFSSDESDQQKHSLCAILPNTHLPRIFIYPTIPGDGPFARLAQRAVTWVIERSGTHQISQNLISCPGYNVYADDDSAVRMALGSNFWDKFARIPGHNSVHLEDDFVQISSAWSGKEKSNMRAAQPQIGNLRPLLDAAEQLCELIQQYSARPVERH